jgi:23S rRNA pseudouridine955/2504/2580 synthase/23S rRNA pseudouridine1911/1915/1917 synthase
LTIFYEDEHLLVVNKPSGLLTIPDRFGNKESLQAELEKQYGKVFVVHRLDRETSGILCFARNEAAHRHLSMQFEHHSTDKFYHALVDGVLHHEEGEINKPIGEHPTIPGKMVVASWGKPSLTFYRALEHFAHFTMVETLIKTGRTHQIRVHLKHIGYPLAVDAVYGRREAFFLSEIKGKKYKSGKFTDEEEKPLMARSSLHSSRLRLDHPVTEERLEFRSELPKDFAAVLNQLRKWDKT